MSKKEFVLDQLAVCRNMESWFKPMSMTLDGLTADQASWQPNQSSHSVAQIASHLLFYNERWLLRFEGAEVEEHAESNASTFTALAEPVEENWRKLAEELDQNMERWQKAVKGADEELLHSKIPGFPVEAVWWEALSNLCTHNAYHIGQMIYIRKMQDAWTIAEDWY